MSVDRTIRASDFVIGVKSSTGEHLHFSITCAGALPSFVFSSTNKDSIFSASGFPGHPKSHYECNWPLPIDQPAPHDVYVLALGFIGATDYTVRVELRDSTGNVVRLVKDIDYKRQDQTDVFPELFAITLS